MFHPLSLAIALRYLRAQRKSYYVSFISMVSMLGIALGVAVLIVVLSVENGFDDAIHRRFFDMAPEITITDPMSGVADWQNLQELVERQAGVVSSAPFVGGQGLMTFQGRMMPTMVTGIVPQYEKKLTALTDKLVAGRLQPLTPFGVVLGQTLAQNLGVALGDKVTLMVPQTTLTVAGAIPRFKRFTVVGLFKAGSGFNFDEKLAFMDMADAQKLFQWGDRITGLRVKTQQIYAAPTIAKQLQQLLGPQYQVGDWTQQFGAFFHAVKMEKTMMFLMLVLIIIVAAFNQVSSLVMLVKDKQSDIAILRTLGMTPRQILRVFVWQGAMVGIIGSTLGLMLGLLVAANVTALVEGLQRLLGVELFASNVFYVDHLPSKILVSDVVIVCLTAWFMSLLATIYPARRAAKIQPVEALRYD